MQKKQRPSPPGTCSGRGHVFTVEQKDRFPIEHAPNRHYHRYHLRLGQATDTLEHHGRGQIDRNSVARVGGGSTRYDTDT